MAMAVFLLIAEIFLLPGITIAGVAGALFAVGGLVFAYATGFATGNITLAASIVAFTGCFLWLMRSNSFGRVALKADVESTVESPRDMNLQVGDKGLTLSRLAPIGKARFGSTTVEAKSVGDFIDENTAVVILRIDGYNVVVATHNPS
jgi:membrane-bound ClpP family serine protease